MITGGTPEAEGGIAAAGWAFHSTHRAVMCQRASDRCVMGMLEVAHGAGAVLRLKRRIALHVSQSIPLVTSHRQRLLHAVVRVRRVVDGQLRSSYLSALLQQDHKLVVPISRDHPVLHATLVGPF